MRKTINLPKRDADGDWCLAEIPEEGWSTLFFCNDKLRELFRIPKGVTEIDVIVSTTRMANCYAVKAEGINVSVHFNGGWNRIYAYSNPPRILKELLKQTGREFLYVAIEY